MALRLPDVTNLGPTRIDGRRPQARVDLTPAAQGEEAIGQVVIRSGAQIARDLEQAATAQARTVAAVGEAAGRATRRGAAEMGAAEIEGGTALARATREAGALEARGFQNLGAGIAGVGEAAHAIVDRNEKFALAAAQARFETGVTNLAIKYDKDRDYATLAERFGTEVDELRNGIGAQLGPLKPKFDVVSQDTVNRTTLKAYKLGRDGTVAEGGRKVENDLDELARSGEAGRSGTIDSNPTAKIDAARARIDTATDQGFYTPEEARARKVKWANEYGKQWISGQSVTTQLKLLPVEPQNREQVIDRVIGVESGGVATAKNPRSSAFGVGQFINSTWLSTIKEARPDIAQGRTDEDLLLLRADPVLSRQMVGALMEKNAATLRDAGLADTPGNLYLAHFLGDKGAIKVLKAAPGTPVDELLSAKAVRDNASILQGRTAGTVANWANARMGAGITGTPVDALTANERTTMYVKLQVDLATATKAQEEAAEKARKELGENLLKEAYDRAAAGNLTPDVVATIKPYVTSAQHHGLVKILQGGAEVDDQEAIAVLTQRLDTDNPTEFQKSAVDYLNRGKLKTTTYVALSEKNRSASKDDQPASPYRSGRELVKTTLEPGQLLDGPAAAIARSAQAQAMTEFDNWAAANPRAARADMLNEAQEIIKRYQVVPFDQMKFALGMSRYFGRKDRSEIKVEDIDQAEDALARDIAAGSLSRDQREFEVRLLNNWRGTLVREQATRGPSSGRTPR